MSRYAIIMAGGSGERFFPLSRRHRPKQLLPLLGEGKTLLEHAVERCCMVVPASNVMIITSTHLQEPICELLRTIIPPTNIIAEPAKRNTAGCLTLGAAVIGMRDPSATIAAVPADHYVGDNAAFGAALERAFAYAETHDAIVTFGIPPTRPETGYGYIEIGTAEADGFYRVASFREKPDRVAAEQYVAGGNFLWNSGMFIYRLDVFEQELCIHAPSYGNAIAPLRNAFARNDVEELSAVFGQLPNISIDYALMERTSAIAVLKAEFPWDDLGSWDALRRLVTTDSEGNVCLGRTLLLDSRNATCANYATKPVLLCALGIENIVAVVTDDVVLLCREDNVQQVRRIVEYLASHGMEQWL
ncbi:MAG: mannose-1-phosphate guanylyltransferase [Bacteroidota bacterium]|nr:mannose-1-phosphate guanylyltransferase [Candidatus Kapabacteria bacterium]MCS7301911.1 mannose-1-phosphate guanylyltransferase [Candidatus Kapabacteria bacterium]MCX7936164.1 mannose-1-phosphate guanylyltransferase [Chlorobiota bacterium]MDW8074942.1 mannose-1-phosphate guanylyltransferase [Bacteroidota bacterium]MDW8271581.1 mannose-1-phosphate guanylyltransferase [Bacteroidota bacterium]